MVLVDVPELVAGVLSSTDAQKYMLRCIVLTPDSAMAQVLNHRVAEVRIFDRYSLWYRSSGSISREVVRAPRIIPFVNTDSDVECKFCCCL